VEALMNTVINLGYLQNTPKHYGSKKSGNVEQLSDWQLLKKDSAP
jgi:hypothetical protein